MKPPFAPCQWGICSVQKGCGTMKFPILKGTMTLLLMILFLSGCSAQTSLLDAESTGDGEVAPAFSSSQEEQEEPVTDLEEIYRLYFHPLFLATITAESWDDPQQLSPDAFVHYYLARHYYDPVHPAERDLEREETVDQQVLEQEVMSHFDVSREFLRQSQEYDPDRGVYVMNYLGGAASSKVVGATWNGDRLSISFEYYSPADDTTVIRSGSLQMYISGEEYQYLSCTSALVVELP